MPALKSVTVKELNYVSVNATRAISLGRIVGQVASGSDSIMQYQSKGVVPGGGQIDKLLLDDAYSATIEAYTPKVFSLNVISSNITGDSVNATPVAQKFDSDGVIYVWANPSNSAQSYVLYDDGRNREPVRYLVNHTVAAIVTIANT